MHRLPIIRTDLELDQECCPAAGGLRELHKIHRTLPGLGIPNTSDTDILLDEMNNPIYTVDGESILDNYKDF